ncbi:MAG: recombinase family protein [Oscillospiraceae bacterium]|nr:recombinase family protein [Oscillospiraceae bacterium]
MLTCALYMRLSIADGDLGKDNKDESNSIENQRLLLTRHIEKHPDLLGKIVEYVDDGYTGTNFNRPAFQRMIEDGKKGIYQVILVKDLSRLGRDYIGLGDYMEQIYPLLGIRLIAVNSNYDSNSYRGLTIGLDTAVTNLVNTMYSRDISKKVKSAIESNWKKGVQNGGRPPFGFRINKKAKGNWEIDPEPAAIVKLIFSLACDGWKTKEIAEELNKRGLKTPGRFKKERGEYVHNKLKESELLWDTGKVCKIIGRYEYTGAFVNNRRKTIQPCSSMTRAVPESEWVITEDMHDAIVSKEVYEMAQMAVRNVPKGIYKSKVPYVLRGKIKCGNCGATMAYEPRLYDAAYYCSHALNVGSASQCSRDRFPEREVNGAVIQSLKLELKQFLHLKKQIQFDKKTVPKLYKKINLLSRNIDIKQAERIRLYEEYAEHKITLEKYKTIKQKLTDDINGLCEEKEKLETLLVTESEFTKQTDSLAKSAESVLKENILTEDIVNQFVEVVYVYDSQHIEVKFVFQDLLEEVIERIKAKGGKEQHGKKHEKDYAYSTDSNYKNA